jgi:hypothetical protein
MGTRARCVGHARRGRSGGHPALGAAPKAGRRTSCTAPTWLGGPACIDGEAGNGGGGWWARARWASRAEVRQPSSAHSLRRRLLRRFPCTSSVQDLWRPIGSVPQRRPRCPSTRHRAASRPRLAGRESPYLPSGSMRRG